MIIVDYIIIKLNHIHLRWQDFFRRERRLSYGKAMEDKTFYVVSYDYDTQGLFAIVKSVLSHIMYAVDKGWIPVVDLKDYKCQYRQEGVNAWELFFEQPCGYTLDDIRNAKNVVRSYYGLYPYGQYAFFVDILDSKDKYKPFADVYKEYIRPNSQVRQYMERLRINLNIDDRTLGVLCRGTDYLNRMPRNHPRQPEPQDVIMDAAEFCKMNGYTSVFVASEDKTVLQMFKDEFGERIRYIDQPRLELEDNHQYLSEVTTTDDICYKIAIDYYSALFVLSRCTAIIAGRTAGTIGAVLMSEGYAHSMFYNLGYYE